MQTAIFLFYNRIIVDKYTPSELTKRGKHLKTIHIMYELGKLVDSIYTTSGSFNTYTTTDIGKYYDLVIKLID